jgi:hypothetical protein
MKDKQVKDERLHLYITKAIGVVTVADLTDPAQYERGSIWANVENSLRVCRVCCSSHQLFPLFQSQSSLLYA